MKLLLPVLAVAEIILSVILFIKQFKITLVTFISVLVLGISWKIGNMSNNIIVKIICLILAIISWGIYVFNVITLIILEPIIVIIKIVLDILSILIYLKLYDGRI